MQKYLGYVISGAGLAIMLLGFGTFKLEWGILNIIKPGMITTVGVAAIMVGVVILMKYGKEQKPQHAQPEIPIYQGEKIVGYRRA